MTVRGIKKFFVSGLITLSVLTSGLAIHADYARAADYTAVSDVLKTLQKTRNDSGWLVKLYQAAASGLAGKSISVKEQVVNVRSGPGTEYAKVGSVKIGQVFSVKEQSGDWYKVDLGGGNYGWIANWLVTLQSGSVSQEPQEPQTPQQPETPQEPETPSTGGAPVDVSDKYLVIKESVVNVRSGPGTQYGIVLKAKIGEQYQITQQNGDWYRVSLPDKSQGWVAGWLAEIRALSDPSRGDAGSGNSGGGDGSGGGTNIPAEPIKLTGFDTGYPVDGEENITINTDSKMDYTVNYMKDPDRLVIDIKNCDINGSSDINVGGNLVSIIRVAQYSASPYVARIVLDLNAAAGYKAVLGNQGTSLKITVAEASIKNKTIVIDAGHGGYDPGAIGSALKEKDYNLAAALLLRDKLTALGANVVMTRADDTFISLTERCNIANNAKADLFVSIHANSSTSVSTNGTSTYFYAPSSNQTLYAQLSQRKKLATAVQSKLVAALGTRNIGVLQENFAVLRGTNMPSILVESAFISNAAEQALLSDAAKRDKIADAIAQGIVAYFSS